jgi:hypothetical protein
MTNIDWSKVSVRELEPLPPRPRLIEPFTVVQLVWAAKAAEATNTQKAFVWLWLVQQAHKTKSNTITMSNEVLARYGVSGKVKRSALRQLEAAGLVTVERHLGKAPRVTLLR